MKLARSWLARAAAAYTIALLGVLAFGAWRFAGLYAAPAPAPGTEFAPSYRMFLAAGGGLIALALLALAAALSFVSGRWWAGFCGLVAGLAVTIAALSALPWVRFPHDRYSAGAAWAFSWAPVCVGLWALIVGVGFLRRSRQAWGRA